MQIRVFYTAKVAVIILVSVTAAIGTYRGLGYARRTRLLAKVGVRQDDVVKMSKEIKEMLDNRSLDEQERVSRLKRMNKLLTEMGQYARELSRPSEGAIIAALAVCVVLSTGGFLLLARGASARARVAFLLDRSGAKAQRLAVPESFRFDENRLVVLRPPRPDSLEDLHDLRLALAKLLGRPGEELEIDASAITSASSQILAAFIEAALEARKHAKELRIIVSETFAELAATAGLDKVTRIETRK